MKSILVFYLVVSLVVVGKSEPGDTYGGSSGNGNGNGNVGGSGGGSCYLNCIFNDCKKGAFQCAVCIGKCAILGTESYSFLGRQMTNRDFCNIGCSTAVCTKFALPNDQYADEKQVKGCLNSCSQRCSDSMY